MSFRSAIEEILGNVLRGTPIVICKWCERDSDEHVGGAGDYGVCHRCHVSVTSKTGISVRELRL